MKIAGQMLGAVMLSAAGAGRAAAGEHVDWLDDGTVLLKLGPAYDNAVIETSVAELGSRCRAGQEALRRRPRPPADPGRRAARADLRARSRRSGRSGRSSPAPSSSSALVPVTELYAKMMLDLRRAPAATTRPWSPPSSTAT